MLLFSFLRRRLKQMPLWKIHGPPAVSFLTGNHAQMYHVGAAQFHEHIMKIYGRVIRVTGFLWDTVLLISDPKACATILGDQEMFEETDWFIESSLAVFGPGLFGTLGAHHRKQRKQLNPVFSVKQVRCMTPLFHNITSQARPLSDILHAKAIAGPQEVDMIDWFGRVALELIAQGGLGHTLADTMHRHTRAVFDEKKARLERGDDVFKQQLNEGKDIISVLMQKNSGAEEEDRLPDEEILAQMSSLVFAATDTTSTALSRILYLLAQHPDVQETLRAEINDAHVRTGEPELGFDALFELPYLEAVCRETLRVFPPPSYVSRVARADTSLPLSRPIDTDGGAVSSLYVPRGTTVGISILGVNRDPSIWGADAAEWKPARWLAPLPDSVAAARVPGLYANTLTFLGGGRSCIGFKFAQLEMKVVLSRLISAFRFSPSEREIVWRFGGLTTPSVKGSTVMAPQLPMILERVKGWPRL
ncbi:cytochrome P450 [Artomyces pyxidatus]|uniref:Cytochrome P450 n=1 Tax=Artomyces pyxidatus TaxID=48021 RepID=A0ACB8SH42_9AGAM|nr:cytochrome P450 [Artomyces pyxidatus]